jgi:hypothetical protein
MRANQESKQGRVKSKRGGGAKAAKLAAYSAGTFERKNPCPVEASTRFLVPIFTDTPIVRKIKVTSSSLLLPHSKT